MHINLNSVPGAFSPGVVMSPGTFYGRPGEAPTFINAAVGAPLTMRGGDGDASEEGSAGVHEQAQQGQGQVSPGQWYHQPQTHGAYFYAMSSPRRKTPTGMEPKGYFDPLFFPAGVNVGSSGGGGGGGGGGYSSSVGGSGALVNEIMKDGRAQNLDVEEGRRKGVGRGEEEETHISDDGDDEKDSGDDDDVDGDDDDSGDGEPAKEGEDLEAHDTDTYPSTSEGKDGDRRPTKGAGAGASFWNSSESSISRTQSLPLNVSHPHQQQQHTCRGLGGEVFTVSDEGVEDAEAIQIPTKVGLGSTPIQHQIEVNRFGEGDGGDDVGLEDVTSGFGTMKSTAHVPWKTTTISRSMAAAATTDVKEK
jgi:hypothetical protein